MLEKISIGEHYTIHQYRRILEIEERNKTFTVEKYLNYKRMLEEKIGVSLGKIILDDNYISSIINWIDNECNKSILNYNSKIREFIKDIESIYGISSSLNCKCNIGNQTEIIYELSTIYKYFSDSFISCIKKVRKIIDKKKDSKYYELEKEMANNTLNYIKDIKALENLLKCIFIVEAN